MQTPPVCNYEGSDYQTSFWDEGGRAYEDAAEALALKKLLPESGRHLLELGAGAGRNTPRYPGYNQITLLDYSHTQLEQARERLGESIRYRFVAADIYRLPFVSGVFDGATMIRTLHHMADAPAALGQVKQVLQPGGTFILEFANKRNLKAMLRYFIRKQNWSPYSAEPVEFAALNFDFHPRAVFNWLSSLGFSVEKILTVSHFRMGLLKRAFSPAFLVKLENLIQWTGQFWQFSPSVFVRAKAAGVASRQQPAGFFACPACQTPLHDTPPLITCPNCGRTYPVANGIYDFRIDPKGD
ncbi:MAG: methyltransferase domain-containing protein [Anaerolineaceae bacterium]